VRTVNGQSGEVTVEAKDVNALGTDGGTMTSGLLDVRKANTQPPFWVRMATNASQNGVTSIGPGAEYIRLGGGEWNVNSYRLIGFGYTINPTDYAPAYIGYQEIVKTGNTNGNLLFATRTATTNSAPVVRFQINADGNLLAAAGYTPPVPQSLATKAYVDGLPLGTVRQLASNTNITTLRDWDYFLLNGVTSFALPNISTVMAAGTRAGSHMIVANWKGGAVPVSYPQSCYMPTGACPTALNVGDVYMYQIDGNVWRATKIAGSQKGYANVVTNGSVLAYGNAYAYSGSAAGAILPACANNVKDNLTFLNIGSADTVLTAAVADKIQTGTASNQTSVAVPRGAAADMYCNGAGMWLAVVK
jgi:hypothetical protein